MYLGSCTHNQITFDHFYLINRLSKKNTLKPITRCILKIFVWSRQSTSRFHCSFFVYCAQYVHLFRGSQCRNDIFTTGFSRLLREKIHWKRSSSKVASENTSIGRMTMTRRAVTPIQLFQWEFYINHTVCVGSVNCSLSRDGCVKSCNFHGLMHNWRAVFFTTLHKEEKKKAVVYLW